MILKIKSAGNRIKFKKAFYIFFASCLSAFSQSQSDIKFETSDEFQRNNIEENVETNIDSPLLEITGRALFSNSSPQGQNNGSGTFVDFERSLGIGRIGAFDWNYMISKPLILQYQGGNVGIGTTNPRVILDVAGRGIFSASVIGVYSGKGTFIDYEPSQNIGRIGAFDWDIKKTMPLILQYQGGNVGIGTITPQRVLHVANAIRMEPIQNPPDNPSKGDMYFGTDGKLHLYNGSAWFSVYMTPD